MADEKKSADDYEWSDDLCIKVALEDYFPSAVYDLTIQKKIINKFLNFYLGGRPPPGMSVYDLIYSTISIMPLEKDTEDFIWKPVHYRENGTLFFLTADEILKADIRMIIEKQKTNTTSEKVVQEGHDEVDVNYNDEDLKVRSSSSCESRAESDSEAQTIDTAFKEKEGGVNHEKMYDKNGERTYSENLPDSLPSCPSTFENIDAQRCCDKSENKDRFSEVSEDPFLEKNSEEDRKSASPSIPKFPATLAWYHRNNHTNQEVMYRTFSPADNSAFIISCNSLLKHWDTSADARMFLKYFFGMVALTLMRATTKSYKHLVNTFSSEKYIGMLPKTALVPFKYVMPHKLCLKMSYRAFYKRGANIRIMFAKLVVNSVFHISNTETKFNPFMMGVLAHTSQYGMGILSLVHHTRRYFDLLNHIIEVTYCKETAESWHRIVRFADRYLSTNPSLTVWWARLIDPAVFAELACPQNYPLAVILASFIETWSKNSNVWRSKWVSGPKGERVDDLKKYQDQANKMFRNIKTFDASFVGNFEFSLEDLLI